MTYHALAGVNISNVAARNCERNCLDEEALDEYAIDFATLAFAAAAATGPAALAATIVAMTGIPAVYAACLAQCAWDYSDCYIPSVCGKMAAKYPTQVLPEYIDEYCDLSDAKQAQVDAICNRVYNERELGARAQPKTQPKDDTGTGTGTRHADEDYPWRSYSSATVALQKKINGIIAPKGYCALITDGLLGAGTCGAARVAGVAPPSTCESFTTPSRCGGGASRVEPAQSYEPAPRGANKALMIGGGLALAGLGTAAYLFFHKKKAA